MVFSQRETNISSNIRAIIKQLNLNPIEKRNYLNRERENKVQIKNVNKINNNHMNKISIGVYGYKDDYNETVVQNANKYHQRTSTTRQKVAIVAKTTTTRTVVDRVDHVRSQPKEDLPELESNRLNHEAAKYRITVRPKNRRPPNRITSQQIGPQTNIPTITESSDTLDSLEESELETGEDAGPIESKNVTVIRKSSSTRLIRSPEILGELEAKLNPQGSSSPCSGSSKSPDSLDASVSSPKNFSNNIETENDDRLHNIGLEIKPVSRKLSNRISKGSDIFAELSSKLPRRRSSANRASKSPDSLENTCWSKSTDSFDRLEECNEGKPSLRKSLNFISKSSERVSKSSDSLEALETLNAVNSSDDSIERRRSSYEFRAVQRTTRGISKSSESFGGVFEETTSRNNNETSVALESYEEEIRTKRSSASDVTNITTNAFYDKVTMAGSKSGGENVDNESENISAQQKTEPKRSSWRPSKRVTVSSESSDNLELDDELENRRARKPPKRIPSTSVVDIVVPPIENDNERKPPLGRKLCRFQKSSESSELGSTDTVDSEKKNKSSASVETIDSLERDTLDNHDPSREEEIGNEEAEKREKNEPWSSQVSEPANIEMEDNTKPLISEKSYWRQSSDAKENIDIHQLLALTIVTHMADNGNQRNSVLFPKKKLSSSSSPPTSPDKQEDNKIIFNNLLSSKNDEDLQNMLNGNISEVSTDTKSFKEKLIMFEKLGK